MILHLSLPQYHSALGMIPYTMAWMEPELFSAAHDALTMRMQRLEF